MAVYVVPVATYTTQQAWMVRWPEVGGAAVPGVTGPRGLVLGTERYSLTYVGRELAVLAGTLSTAAHNALVADPDVILIANLNEVLTAGRVTAIQTYLGRFNVPNNWISAGMTIREVLRRLAWMGQMMERIGGKMADAGLTQTTQWKDVPAGVKTRLSAFAVEKSLDTSGITTKTTLGEVLRRAADQIADNFLFGSEMN